MGIQYIQGNLFDQWNQYKTEYNIIPHVVNNVGAWGAGFTQGLDAVYPDACRSFIQYTNLFSSNNDILGNVGLCQCFHNDVTVCVAHMFAQNGVGTSKKRLVDTQLQHCMRWLDVYAESVSFDYSKLGDPVSFHCPKFGCGLAGGNWNDVERYINDIWRNYNVFVYVM